MSHRRCYTTYVNAPQDRYIKIGSTGIRYWDEGQGAPLLLVHGLGGFAENWAANIFPLAERYRVLVPDLPGFGRSGKIPAPRSMFDFVRFLNEFMEALGIEKGSLAGNSLGGGLVLQFAVQYPQKVEKLVLVDNAGMGRDVINDFKVCSIPLLGELLLRPTRNASIATWRKVVHDPAVITDEFIDLGYELMTLPGAKKALMSTIRAGVNVRGQRMELVRELTAGLGSVTAPALIIWGRQDRILPVAHAHICHERLPGSRLEIFDDCGHMPQLEHPDRFNALVLEFLDGRTESTGVLSTSANSHTS